MSDPPPSRDLAASPFGFALHWGPPILAMLAAVPLTHPLKTWVWVAALVWMGGLCLWNAHRCGRRHCFWTGPFFLTMTLPVLAYGYAILPLGSEGWKWLGMFVGLGAVTITAITERGGRY